MAVRNRAIVLSIATVTGFGIGQYYYKKSLAKTREEEHVFPPTALTSEPQLFTLRSKEYETPDVRRFRFETPGKRQSLGIAPGQHVLTQIKVGDEMLFRPYSPVTSESDKGYFDLVMKIYPENDKFTKGGRMSRHFDSLHVGDTMPFKGPIGRCKYNGNGSFTLKYDRDSPEVVKEFKNVGIVVGGTGITPMYQIVKHACNEPSDNTKFQMVFSNHTEDDIIIRSELDSLANKYKDQFKLYYTLSRSAKPDWKFGVGRVNQNMLKANLPPPSSDTLILICGPQEFNKVCVSIMEKLGYSKESIMAM